MEVPPQEGVCFFAVAVVVHLFVYIVVSYTEGHRKECVMEMVRVESTGSLCQPWLGPSSSPRYRCM